MASTNTPVPLYRRKIDAQGQFLPFSGYTIIAHARHPLPPSLTQLVNALSSSELKNYYSFLPDSSYHVTINPLEGVQKNHVSLLKEEQQKFQQLDTTSICTTKQLIRNKVLLMEVEFNENQNANLATIIQTIRSPQLQQAKILKNYTLSWHLTLGYQYRDIENDAMVTKLDEIIKKLLQSIPPFDIPLDHIRICHYDDLTKFTPV